MSRDFRLKEFLLVTLLTSLWVQASEVFRYFVIVMPAMRESLSALPDVPPMNLPVFLIWGLWDTLLTALVVFLYWLCAQAFGPGRRSVLVSGAISWTFFFLLFWVAMVNMNLADWQLAGTALSLALLEMMVASAIAAWLFQHPFFKRSPLSK